MDGSLTPSLALAGIVLVIALLLWARRWIFLVWTIARPAAWPAAWGLLLLAVLGLVPQGQAIVQRGLETNAVWALLIATALASVLMGYAAASLLFVRYEPLASNLKNAREQLELSDGTYDSWCSQVRRIVPLVVLSLPWLAILPGLLLLWFPDLPNFGRLLQLAALPLIVLAAGLLGDTGLLRDRVPSRWQWLWPLRHPDLSDAGIEGALEEAGRAGHHPRLRRIGAFLLAGMLPATRWAFACSVGLGLAAFVAALYVPPAGLELVGTAGIVMAAAASLAVTGALLAHYANRHYSVTLPYLLAVLLLGAGLLARWNLTDNHRVRQVTDGAGQERQDATRRPTLEEHLATWIEARGRDDGRPVPLIVAVAQGGGIRAALWTALALGELQAREPRLPCDLFAITGVSGGAVGAATYAAMLAEAPPACESHEALATNARRGEGYARQAATAFGHDLLAPVAAGLFFPDLLARFLPLPGLPNRQDMLENGLEHAWTEAAPAAHGLDRPLLSLFADPKRVPSLFLVASEVEGGRRWIASNVRIDRNTIADAVDTLAGRALLDSDMLAPGDMIALPVSAAAGLSARFPYVSPAGTLGTKSGVWHLLDGGVVESSGAATAGEILLALRSHCDGGEGVLRCRIVPPAGTERPRAGLVGCGTDAAGCILVRPAVIQLTNDRWVPADTPPRDDPSWMGHLAPDFPETLSPLTALLASRTGRGRAAHDRLQGDPFLLAGGTCTALDIVLNPVGSDLADPSKAVPLGWTLRPQHVEKMQAAIQETLDRSRPATESSLDFVRWRRDLYDSPAPCPGPEARYLAASPSAD